MGTTPRDTATLFDDIRRVDTSYASRSESSFGFLNRTALAEFGNIRPVLEGWFARFPDKGRRDLRARFRSDDPGQHIGAFWELYLHEIHHRLGFTLERDPVVPGTDNRPDFLVRRRDEAFYLEATLIASSDPEAARRRRQDIVLDLVDQAYNPDFSVSIKASADGHGHPSRAEIIDPLEAWLAGLDWDTERARRERGEPPRSHEIHARGWTLHFRAIPRSAAGRGRRDYRMIGMGPASGGIFDERRHILDNLRTKAKKYGRPDHPFVIAALCVRDFADDDDVEQALYGQEVMRVPISPDPAVPSGEAYLEREPNGLWQRGRRRSATRVSAVLSATHLFPWSIAQIPITLWRNPWAAKELTEELPWKAVTADLENDRLVRKEAVAPPHELLGLGE